MGKLPALPFTTWPIDLIAIGFVVLLIAINTYRSGPSRGTSLALGSLIALGLYNLLPKTLGLGPIVAQATGGIHVAIFAGVVILCYIGMTRLILPFVPGGSPIQAICCALATCIIVLAAAMQVPALVELWHPNTLLASIFAESYLVYWITFGLGLLAFTSL